MSPTMHPTVFPVLSYRDAGAAIRFLEEAFGFTTEVRYSAEGDHVDHAELSHGNGVVMVGSQREPDAATGSVPPAPQVLFLAVADPDAHCDRARAAGAEIITPPADRDYGSREYMARDPEGNLWGIGTYWRAHG